jgi:PII-like signaling protein
VNGEALKLSVYFGESDRVEHRLLSDVLVDAFEAEGIQAAVLLRATEGFGVKHRLHTQRLLTLSEDLPLVAVAVDARERIERLLPEVDRLVTGGLVTLERARLVTGDLTRAELPPDPDGGAKLTLYLGRAERVAGRPAYVAAVEFLRRNGLDGATVLLGVDGMSHAERRRGRFFSQNADVPLMVVATGRGEAVSGAVAALEGLLAKPLLTIERARICKRDGEVLAPPHRLPETDDGAWQKLTVHAAEDARHEGHALYLQLIRRLREEGATGATALRGIWGYSGAREPHGDRLLSVRRRVPVVTVVVDTPAAIERWWRVVDEVTDETGLVTSELVPAVQVVGPGLRLGGLRLA